MRNDNPAALIEAGHRLLRADLESYIREEKLLGRKLAGSTVGYYAAGNPGVLRVLKAGGAVRPGTARKIVSYLKRARKDRSANDLRTLRIKTKAAPR